IVRRPLPPLHERLPGRQPVERVVHLDRGELLRVVLQPPRLRGTGRVEALPPVLVLPTRRAYQDHVRLIPAQTGVVTWPGWPAPATVGRHGDRAGHPGGRAGSRGLPRGVPPRGEGPARTAGPHGTHRRRLLAGRPAHAPGRVAPPGGHV